MKEFVSLIKFRHRLGILLLFFIIGRTFFLHIPPISPFMVHLLTVIRVLALLKIALDLWDEDIPKNIPFLGFLSFVVISFFVRRDWNVLSNFLILFSFRTFSFKALLKYFFYFNTLFLFIILTSSQVGILENRFYLSITGQPRYFLGFSHPNAAMRAALNVWVAFVFFYWNRLTARFKSLPFWLFALALPSIFFILTFSRMSFLGILFGSFFFLLAKKVDFNRKIFKFSLALLPMGLTILTFIMALLFYEQPLLNRFFSYRPMFWNYILTLDSHPIRFFGYHPAVLHHLFNGNRLILDSTYLNWLLIDGLGMSIIYLGIFSFLLYDSAHKNNKPLLFLLVTLLTFGFGENVFFDIGTNPLFFLIIPACGQLQLNFLKRKRMRMPLEAPIKILYGITRSDWGGAQVHILDLVREIRTKGYEVEMIIGEKGDLYDRLQELEVCTHYLPSLVHEIKPLTDLKAILDFCQVIRNSKPDFVHLHSTKVGWIGRMASLIMRKPVIFTVHGWCFTDGVTQKRRHIGRAIEKFLAPLTDMIICVSEFDRKLAIEQNVAETQQLEVVYNGVKDFEKIEVVYSGVKNFEKLELECQKKAIKVTMVARFTQQKDQRSLIEAFALIDDSFELYLIGDGVNLPADQERANELGLSNRIHFLGARLDVESLLQEMDIFVLSSNYEGLPISIIEAMSLGLPLVASNVGGVNELIFHGKNGYLFEAKDHHALAARLNQLKDEKLRQQMGHFSRQLYLEKFTLSQFIENTVKVYQKLLRG